MIDAGIYGQFAPRVKSVQDYESEANANENAQLQNMLARQKGSEYLAGVQRQGQIRNALAGLGAGATDEQRVAALRGTNLPEGFDQADKLETAIQTRNKSAADTQLATAHAGHFNAQADAERLKTTRDTASYLTQTLAPIKTPEDAVQWYEDAVRKKLLTTDQAVAEIDKMPQQAGPQWEAWKAGQQQAGLTMQQQAEQAMKTTEEAGRNTRNDATNATSRANNASTNAVTMRGQNLTDARGRESNAAAMSKPFEVTGPDGQPILVQQDKQGNISPVQGFGPKTGSTKPLTDSQAKALGFGTRMQEADKVINEVGGDYSQAGVNAKNAVGQVPIVGGLFEAGANKMLSDNSQRAEQAQRDFLNAILRRESGAAIAQSEFDNARKQYFPEPGDSPAKLAQKAANRKLAAEGVIAEVPKGQRGTIGPQSSPAPLGIDPSAIDAELKRRGH